MSRDKKETSRQEIREVLLATTGNEMELGIFESILRAENITYFVQHKNPQHYPSILTSMPMLGIEIYVSSEDYERARDAITPISGENDQ